ncbi:MAG: cadherin-like beta sandwich domain-containing protein, partial [Bacillota bacterium]|nr:cadherin-like beta sandwich domain-containing protein [Bacillota bacterium]
TITVTREGGAYLTGLDLSSGTLDPVFSQTQDTYKVKVDNDVTSITLTPTAEADSVIKVNEVEVTRGQASAPIDLKTGDNTITVEVSLADGKVNIYTITVTKEGRAYLTGLDLSAGTLNPVFKSAQNTYNLSVGNDVSNITLTPVIDQSDAVIKVNGVEVTNGQASDPINLQVGDNTITVEVTAADGTVNTYTLTVIKEGGGNITGLNLSTGTLNPVFDSVQNTYSLSVGNDVTCMTLTPTAEPDSVIKVNGVEVISGQASAPIDLNVGDNAITIEVSNSDGAVNTYTITVTRESGAYLTGVDLSNGTLDPVFSEKQITYSANVGNDVTSITVSPTAKYTNAVIKVNGVDVTSEQASDPIDLQEGNNVITVEVTAADGTSSTYTITVIRAVNTDNESSIQIESIN